jgi:hypothetical protein
MKQREGDESGGGNAGGEPASGQAAEGDSANRGAVPFSPSNPLDEEGDMDWESGLTGVKDLFRLPPPTGREQGVPASANADSGGHVLPQDLSEERSASPPDKLPLEPQKASSMPLPPPPSSKPESANSNLTGRVELFLQRAKDRSVQEMKDRLGKDLNIYAAIAAHNRRSSTAANLLGGPSSALPAMSGLIDLADGRIMSGGLQLDLVRKKTICTSFSADWTCLRCGEHGAAPAFKIRGIPDSTATRQVVILADQAFPACLPAMGIQECLRILLVESCSILDLVETFLQKLGNRRVPPGSLILIFSESFLQTVGLELYAAELVQAQNRIHTVLGRETIFQPLPPILLGGTDDPALTRSIWELITWSDQYFTSNDYLERSSIRLSRYFSSLAQGRERNWRQEGMPCPLSRRRRSGSGPAKERPGPCPVQSKRSRQTWRQSTSEV